MNLLGAFQNVFYLYFMLDTVRKVIVVYDLERSLTEGSADPFAQFP